MRSCGSGFHQGRRFSRLAFEGLASTDGGLAQRTSASADKIYLRERILRLSVPVHSITPQHLALRHSIHDKCAVAPSRVHMLVLANQGFHKVMLDAHHATHHPPTTTLLDLPSCIARVDRCIVTDTAPEGVASSHGNALSCLGAPSAKHVLQIQRCPAIKRWRSVMARCRSVVVHFGAMPELTIGLARELQTHYYLSLIYFVILYYDYLLTFTAEVQLFWLSGSPRRLSWPSILFLICRYGALLGHIPLIIEVFISPVDNNLLRRTHISPAICGYSAAHHRRSLRDPRLRHIQPQPIRARFPHTPGLGLRRSDMFSISQWVVFSALSEHDHGLVLLNLGSGTTGCNPIYTKSQGTQLALTWGGLLVFDSCVFVLTVVKAFRIGRRYPGSLVHVLLRDGTLYFILLFVANFSNILMYLYAAPPLRSTNTVLTTVYAPIPTSCITSEPLTREMCSRHRLSTVAVSRLMLSLRAAHDTSDVGMDQGGSNPTQAVRLYTANTRRLSGYEPGRDAGERRRSRTFGGIVVE
ncbi:hypothetical protein EVG20_g5517 [Dentipellis fragilis]|uniref:DUF6533 domain-containing protein n=1 Tax=Dentipellis fragilis TaxID=205917 RepID=A0A4Y9YV12_9AGAM|nr:hypothetical protein EVG20_g5517 [Dentipellis fragilis]